MTTSEPMTRVLHELCTEIDALKRDVQVGLDNLSAEQARHAGTRRELEEQKKTTEYAREISNSFERRVEVSQARVRTLTDEATADQIRHNKLLVDAKTLDTDLFHYIVELAGHRDTDRTKAVRVALGHVVERLSEIRGMNGAEAQAVA